MFPPRSLTNCVATWAVAFLLMPFFPMEKWSESLLISLRMIPRFFFVSPRIIFVVVNPQLLNIPEGRHVLDFFGSTFCGYLSSQQVEMMPIPSNSLNVVFKTRLRSGSLDDLAIHSRDESHQCYGSVVIELVLSTHIWTLHISFTVSHWIIYPK